MYPQCSAISALECGTAKIKNLISNYNLGCNLGLFLRSHLFHGNRGQGNNCAEYIAFNKFRGSTEVEFVSLYGEKKWGVSMYDSQNSLIANYINPIIGDMKVQDITTRVVDKYIQSLQKTLR